ncbi:MAG: cysteine desulfurase family protein [Patescibacteria group bacterium]
MIKRIYLDYAAATPLDPQVLKVMLPFLKTDFANPSSIHAGGVRARRAIDEARVQVAKLIKARPTEIIFTSGATESINLAILGAARANAHLGKHIVSVTTEHKATLRALELEGFEITLVPVNAHGQVTAAQVLAAVRPDTILVSVMLVNNELGVLAPVADIGKGLLKHQALLHTDAAQANGVIELDVEQLHVDLMTLSAAKMYGPKGIGAMYLRTGTKLRQIMAGGNHEFGYRPGTENVPAIVGFGLAAQLATVHLGKHRAHLDSVRATFLKVLQAECPQVRVNGDSQARAPHILNLTFVGLDGEELVLRLDALGIACSTAAACKSSDFPSHVLRAIGLPEAEIRATVRFSFGRQTSAAEAKRAAQLVAKCVDQLSS